MTFFINAENIFCLQIKCAILSVQDCQKIFFLLAKYFLSADTGFELKDIPRDELKGQFKLCFGQVGEAYRETSDDGHKNPD